MVSVSPRASRDMVRGEAQIGFVVLAPPGLPAPDRIRPRCLARVLLHDCLLTAGNRPWEAATTYLLGVVKPEGVSLHPTELLYALATISRDLGRIDEALEAVRTLVLLHPEAPRLLAIKMQLESMQGR